MIIDLIRRKYVQTFEFTCKSIRESIQPMIIIFLCTVSLSGCYLKSNLTLYPDVKSSEGNANQQSTSQAESISVNVYNATFLDTYFKDLSQTFSKNTAINLFEESMIRSYFLTNPNFELKDIKIKDNTMDMAIDLKKDISNVFLDKKGDLSHVISKIQKDNIVTLAITLDKAKIEGIINSMPFVDNNLITYLGPGTEKLSYKEYENNLVWIFSDYGNEKDIRDSIQKSIFEMKVVVPIEVVSCLNCTKLSKDTVQFNIPILKLMTEQNPTTYSVSYKVK